MKVHTDLKELLMDFGLKASKYTNNFKDKRNPKQFVDDYLSINSLAYVEPEPLAKNKDSESKCAHCNGSGLDPKNKTLYYKPCPRCS